MDMVEYMQGGPDSIKRMQMISRDRDHSEGQGAGGQRLFGIFPKIHPIWYCDPSLRKILQ